MKKLLSIAVIILYATCINAQVTQEWVQTFAGGIAPWNKGVATDNSGNVYTAGQYYNGSVEYMRLQKFDAAGILLWTENYLPAGSTSASARAMVIDSNGDLIVSGVINNSSNIGFTRKYDPNGQLLWSQSTTSSNFSLTTDEFNNVYVTSWDMHGGGGLPITTIKYDAAGNTLWTVINNSNTFAGTHGKIFYKAGFLYRTGGIWMTFNARNVPVIYTIKTNASTGAQVWAKTYYHADKIANGGKDLVVDASGNVYVSAYVYTKAGSNQNQNWVTLKYNSAGTQQWATFYDGNGNDYYVPRTGVSTGFDTPVGITMDNSNNIIVTGESYTATGQFTSQDMTTIKYSPAGAPLWVRTYDSPAHGNDAVRAITIDASSNVYITGTTNATTIKYNSAGTQQWIVNYSGGTNMNVHIDNTGNVYTGGSITGNSLLIKYSQSGPLTKRDIFPVENITQAILYPNPAINQINIRNNNNKPLGTVSIYNISGKMIYKNLIGSSQATIDVKKFSPGVYYLRSDKMEKAIKFVKQ